MRRVLLAAALAACRSPAPTGPTLDAPSPDATPADARLGPAITATVDSTRFVTREHMLAAGEMQIALGAQPATGTSSSGGAGAWSAFAFQRVGEGGGTYRAGNAVAPPGSFTLALTTADPAARAAHGTLDLAMRVLTTPGTDCGDLDTETLTLAF